MGIGCVRYCPSGDQVSCIRIKLSFVMALYNCTYTLFFDKPICVSSRQSITQFDVYYSSHQSNKLLPTVIHSNEHQTYGTYKYKSSRVEKFINQSNSIYTRGAACKSRATIVAQQRATARRGKKHSVAYVHASVSRRRKNAEVIKRDTNRSSTDIYIYVYTSPLQRISSDRSPCIISFCVLLRKSEFTIALLYGDFSSVNLDR